MDFEAGQLLVIKVGTSTLSESAEGTAERLHAQSFERIGSQVLQLAEAGNKVVIVSSAAITAGMVACGICERPKNVAELRRLAGIGWGDVASSWKRAIPRRQVPAILLTDRELGMSHERHTLTKTLRTMFDYGDIPVANENDVIADEQIKIGDNDTLAARLAVKIKSSGLFTDQIGLILLSDVNSVLSDVKDPTSRIDQISTIAEYRHVAGDSTDMNGTGGMRTKFDAAEIATTAGVPMWIANGRTDNVIVRAMSGEIGTFFPAH